MNPVFDNAQTDLLRHRLLVAAIEKGRDIDHWNLVEGLAFGAQLIVQSGHEIFGHEYRLNRWWGVVTTISGHSCLLNRQKISHEVS
jgi:hypothetical protein